MNEIESGPAGESSARASGTNTGARLDRLIAERGLARSRERAQAMIAGGLVTVDGQPAEKASQIVSPDSAIEILGEAIAFVGRGGLKLEAALKHFRLNVSGMTCLDVGSSTGGFTDCLLQRGAAKVVALDVGHGQLAESLKTDPRVELREGVNARYLSPAQFDGQFDLAAIDVSFISLTLVLPAVAPLSRPGGHILALVKPEFEVGRKNIGPGGIVRDEDLQWSALKKITHFGKTTLGLEVRGTMRSPHVGGGRNREFFAWFQVPAENANSKHADLGKDGTERK